MAKLAKTESDKPVVVTKKMGAGLLVKKAMSAILGDNAGDDLRSLGKDVGRRAKHQIDQEIAEEEARERLETQEAEKDK